MARPYVLIVDDDDRLAASYADLLRELLQLDEVDLETAHSGAEALLKLDRPGAQLLLTDYHLGPGPSGIVLIEHAARMHPGAGRFLMSGEDPERMLPLLTPFVHAFFQKGVPPRELEALVAPFLPPLREPVVEEGHHKA